MVIPRTGTTRRIVFRRKPITPAGIAPRPARRLSKKTILNIHIALSSLWTWATREGYVKQHVVRLVRPPTPEDPVIELYSKEDVQAILTACLYSQPYSRPGKRECRNHRPTADRDRAIVLLLLDTGARVSEVVENSLLDTHGLLIQDVDQRNLAIKVLGKGSKERIIPISSRTMKAIWRYLLTRPDAQPTDALFTSQDGAPLPFPAEG